MDELKYKFTHDTLFKLLFVKHPDLLKRLVAAVLGIPLSSITEFRITNPEIPPEMLGDKFCRLDINMVVDGIRVNLEVQVGNEGDYPERSLFHWAREYSSALAAGKTYSELPRVVIISILDESMFNCAEYHSEFRPLEVTRHEILSDKMVMHYFEVRKLPKEVDAEHELELLLSLFRARTEEDLKRLEGLGVPVVTQAIEAYREVTVSPEFRELERLRELARHNEASALAHARRKEAEKWQSVVADRDARIADRDARIADRDARIAQTRAEQQKLQGVISDKDARIAELEALLTKNRQT